MTALVAATAIGLALVGLGYMTRVAQEYGYLPHPDRVEIRTCRSCGCTDERACDPICWWVAPDLCSTCSPVLLDTDNVVDELRRRQVGHS